MFTWDIILKTKSNFTMFTVLLMEVLIANCAQIRSLHVPKMMWENADLVYGTRSRLSRFMFG